MAIDYLMVIFSMKKTQNGTKIIQMLVGVI